MFQSVGFDDVHGGEQHTEFAGRESLPLEPFEVGDRQSRYFPTLVFPKRHFSVVKFFQDVWVGHHCT